MSWGAVLLGWVRDLWVCVCQEANFAYGTSRLCWGAGFNKNVRYGTSGYELAIIRRKIAVGYRTSGSELEACYAGRLDTRSWDTCYGAGN